MGKNLRVKRMKPKAKMEKTFIVKSADWECLVTLDMKLHGDLFVMEAATQAVEQEVNSDSEKFNIGAIISVQDVEAVDEDDSYMISSYNVLINASMFEFAERMRECYIKDQGYDLKTGKKTNKYKK